MTTAGTNPLCFGIPSDDEFPFVIDCATSINQRGKIEKYAREGVDTPKGVVVDEFGVERTDTEGILKDMVLGKCALNPVGGAGDKTAGYKGYGWATVVELLSTAFQSGPVSIFHEVESFCSLRFNSSCTFSSLAVWRRCLWCGSSYRRKEAHAVGSLLFGD